MFKDKVNSYVHDANLYGIQWLLISTSVCQKDDESLWSTKGVLGDIFHNKEALIIVMHICARVRCLTYVRKHTTDYWESNSIGILDVYSHTPSRQSIHLIFDWLFGVIPSKEHVTKGKNAPFGNGFVKILANCLLFGLQWISTRPDSTWNLKWWYLKDICLVLGESFLPVAILIQYWFSSWTFQTKLGFEVRIGNT